MYLDLIPPSIEIGQKETELPCFVGMPTWGLCWLSKIQMLAQMVYRGICHFVSLDFFLTYNLAYILTLVIPLGILYTLIMFTKVPTKDTSPCSSKAVIDGNQKVKLPSTEKIGQREATPCC